VIGRQVVGTVQTTPIDQAEAVTAANNTIIQHESSAHVVMTSSDRLTYADALKLVSKSIGQSDRRKSNIVVSEIRELTAETDTDTDIGLFINICTRDLSFDVRNKIVATKRLGTVIGAKSFNSVNAVTEILSRAKLLRNSLDGATANSVFINMDLSREDSRIAYILDG